MTRTRFTLMLGVLTLALFGISGAEAVGCGDTVGPGGSVTLTGDLICFGSALTVHGPTIVDLGGHTVNCGSAGGGASVAITGSGAVVRNGRVVNCDVGVGVGGSGGHQVKNVLVQSSNIGFEVLSPKNTLINNAAMGNGHGFFVASNGNVLQWNTAASNAIFGFWLGSANGNVVRSNTATANGNNGFELEGAIGNALASNNAFGNIAIGISLHGGSTKNVIQVNVSLGNSTNDLEDDNFSCDTNSWTGNVFGTKDPTGCIH